MPIDDAYYQNQIRLDVGDIGVSAEHEIVFPVETTGGTWDFTLAGATVAGIAFPNAAATVQSALEGAASIGTGNVSVRLGQRGFILNYQNTLANQEIPLPTVSGINLILSSGGAASVPVRQNKEGKTNHWTDVRLTDMWERRAAYADVPEVQFLSVKLDAIRELKGIIWPQIDQQTGDARRDYEKQFAHLVQMENATAQELEDLTYGEESDNQSNANQSYHATPTIRTTTQAKFDAKFGRRCA